MAPLAETNSQQLCRVVFSLLKHQPGAELELCSLVRPSRCGGGLSPDELCDLALQLLAQHGPASTISDWAFAILGKQLGVGFFFALMIAASHQRDTAGCLRCLRVLCDRSRFRWRPFQSYHQLAKRRGLCLQTLRPLLPRREALIPQSTESSHTATTCTLASHANARPNRDWRQRRPLWSHLACHGNVDELLDQAEHERRERGGQDLNSLDLAFLLRAARRNGTSAQLLRTLRLVPPAKQAEDGVLLQEVLCALRRLRQPMAAWQLVEQAQQTGLRLNCLHYTTLLAMCGDHKDRAGVRRILSEMHEQGIARDALFTATLRRLQASR